MGRRTLCAEQQSCLYLCQISASSELVQNMLQKHAVETKFWYVNVFSNQSLFVRVTEDQRYVIVLETRNRQKIFKQIFFCCLSSCYLQSMKKIQLLRRIYNSLKYVHNAILKVGQTHTDQFSIKFAEDYFDMKT